MKLDQFDRNVMTSAGESTQFGANMNGVAFSILSKSIYEHPIAAIIRELTCNAIDSHIEAGKGDMPVTITLPNQLNPNFSVEDQGIGLDDEGVRQIFACYFGSTKTQTNELVGSFGLGSKSFYAYSETAMLRARKDGIERRYSLFLDKDSMPSISLLREVQTDEPNGVMIQVPVQEKDFHRFTSETKAIVSGFKVAPIVQGTSSFTPDAPNLYEQIDTQGWAKVVFNGGSALYSDGLYAIMGGVFYRLPSSLRYELDDFVGYMQAPYSNDAIVFPFEIGELAPAASRETLSIDDHHMELIKKRLNSIIKNEKQKTQDDIDKCSNKLEAMRLVFDKFDSMGMRIFTYKGQSLNRSFHLDLDIPYDCVHKHIDMNRHNKIMLRIRPNAMDRRSASFWNRNIVGVYAESKTTKATLERNLRAYANGNRDLFRDDVLIFTKPMSETKRNRIDAFLGREVDWLSYEDMKAALPEKERSQATKKDRGQATKNTIFAKHTNGYGDWMQAFNVELDDNKTYYYVDDQDSILIAPNTIGDDIVVLLRNKQNSNKMERFGVTPYYDVQKQFAERHKDQVEGYLIQSHLDIGNTSDGNKVFRSFGTNSFAYKLKEWGATYTKEIDEVLDSVNTEGKLNRSVCMVIAGRLLNFSDVYEKAGKLQEKLNTVRSRYQLLIDIDMQSHNLRRSQAEQLIRLIEKDMDSTLDLTQAA